MKDWKVIDIATARKFLESINDERQKLGKKGGTAPKPVPINEVLQKAINLPPYHTCWKNQKKDLLSKENWLELVYLARRGKEEKGAAIAIFATGICLQNMDIRTDRAQLGQMIRVNELKEFWTIPGCNSAQLGWNPQNTTKKEPWLDAAYGRAIKHADGWKPIVVQPQDARKNWQGTFIGLTNPQELFQERIRAGENTVETLWPLWERVKNNQIFFNSWWVNEGSHHNLEYVLQKYLNEQPWTKNGNWGGVKLRQIRENWEPVRILPKVNEIPKSSWAEAIRTIERLKPETRGAFTDAIKWQDGKKSIEETIAATFHQAKKIQKMWETKNGSQGHCKLEWWIALPERILNAVTWNDLLQSVGAVPWEEDVKVEQKEERPLEVVLEEYNKPEFLNRHCIQEMLAELL